MLEGFVSVKTLNRPPISAILWTNEYPPWPRASRLYKRWLDLMGSIFSALKHSPKAISISRDFWAGHPCLPSSISLSSSVSLIENPPVISVRNSDPICLLLRLQEVERHFGKLSRFLQGDEIASTAYDSSSTIRYEASCDFHSFMENIFLPSRDEKGRAFQQGKTILYLISEYSLMSVMGFWARPKDSPEWFSANSAVWLAA